MNIQQMDHEIYKALNKKYAYQFENIRELGSGFNLSEPQFRELEFLCEHKDGTHVQLNAKYYVNTSKVVVDVLQGWVEFAQKMKKENENIEVSEESKSPITSDKLMNKGDTIQSLITLTKDYSSNSFFKTETLKKLNVHELNKLNSFLKELIEKQ